MLGRKLEENDWSEVYCRSKGLPCRGWSNLSIDVAHDGLGIEHKMLCVRQKKSLKDYCGTTQMHPSATRSIRIPKEKDATKAAREILRQYGQNIIARSEQMRKDFPDFEPDMRTGWLLWEASLSQFMYFEEPMLIPTPEDFTASWEEKRTGTGFRKSSKNLWVYDRAGRKRFSITTSAGPKIQPYFDVPLPDDPNLYFFTVQGEMLENGLVRIWITPSTAYLMRDVLGTYDTQTISNAILQSAGEAAKDGGYEVANEEPAVELRVTLAAYETLRAVFTGNSDEHSIQLVLRYLHEHRPSSAETKAS